MPLVMPSSRSARDFGIFEVQSVQLKPASFDPLPVKHIVRSIALAAALATSLAAAEAPQPVAGAPVAATRVDYREGIVSPQVRHIAEWAVHSGDHQRLPFIVVDKINASAAAFDASGRLLRTTPVLLGIGVGDTFAPGVAQLEMHQTQPWQRITPAGRFFADEGRNLEKQRVLWVDYDAGIAIHKIPTKRTPQRRQERMVSPDPAEHRITYGCINVPAVFYDTVVRTHFRQKGGIVYVLPDTLPLKSVFKSYDVGYPAGAAPVQQSAREASQATRKF
jgi:hypothetical protein